MDQYASHISFYCPECGNENSETIRVPETYWAGCNSDERMTEDATDAGCDVCLKSFALRVQNRDGRINVTMYDYEDVAIDAGDAYLVDPDPDDFDYLLLFDVPSEPARFLEETLRDTWNVLESARAIAESKTLYRMVFIQQFAALEAYLCDTLIGEVLRDPKALYDLVKEEKELMKKTYSAGEILTEPDIIKQDVVDHLRAELYHNLPKIQKVWKFTLGFPLFGDTDVQRRLNKAVKIRHDCVHRNGRDKDGNARKELVWRFLSQMDTDLRSLMRHVEKNVKRRKEEDRAEQAQG